VKSVQLWTQPFQAVLDQHTLPQTSSEPFRQRAAAEFAPLASRPELWLARVYHFQGNKDVRAEDRNDPLAEKRQGHQEAVKLYPSVRPANAELAQRELDERTVRAAGKAAAAYWLGLLSYDRGNFDVALNWLGERTLNQASEGRWAYGARYNLARTHEALGNVEEAAKLLQSDPKDAPQRHGNLIRARRLQSAAADKQPAP
jgi:tetratricopeptide (TPR) repeat protein